MDIDLKKAVRDYLISSIALFATSAYTVLDSNNIFNNLSLEVLVEASRTGVNALWIALPSTVGLYLHRKIRPNKEETTPIYN